MKKQFFFILIVFHLIAVAIEGQQIVIESLVINPISCNGSTDGDIYVSVSGGSGNFVYTLLGSPPLFPILESATIPDTEYLFEDYGTGSYTVYIYQETNITNNDLRGANLFEPAAIQIQSSSASDQSCFGNVDGEIIVSAIGEGGNLRYTLTGPVNDNNTTGIFTGLSAGSYDVTVTDDDGCSSSDNVSGLTIDAPDPYTVTATLSASTTGGFNLNCNGDSNGTISISVTGGTSPYSYSWTTADGSGLAAGDKDQSGLTAGTYIVTITDANGCLFSDSYTLTQPANPLSVSAVLSSSSDGAYNLNCFADNDGTINITPANGNGTYSYTWSTTDGSGLVASDEDQSGLTAGTYNVTITDDNGCNISDSYTLTQPNLLSASATLSSSTAGGYNINCNGNSDGSITLNTTGGIPAYSYSWSTADGSGIVIADKDQSGLTAGTYIVSITDVNSCNFSDSYTLIQPDPLTATATFSASTTGGFNINCNGGNDGSISLSVSNGTSPYSYSWTTADGSGLAAGDKDQSGLTAGTYNVTITDANGCLFSDSYTLTQPANPLSVSAVLSSSSDGAYNLNCFADNDGTINITPANGNGTYSYTWSTTDGSGLVASDEDQSGLTAGTYNVTITDDNGCNISDSYTLTQPNLLSASATLSSSIAGGYNINCNGNSDGSITLNTTGGIPAYSYSWSTADGSGIVIADKDQSGLTAGTYIVSITDVNSCNFSDSYTLIQPDPLTATATFSASTTGGFNINCNGGNDGSISLSVSNGTSPYSYSWTTADGSGLAAGDKDQSGLTAGTYIVTITDANGCLFSDSYTLTQPANPLSVSAVLSSSSDGAYNLNCFADNDGTINITPANGNGTYSYTWSTTDGSGLVASDEDQSGLTAGTYNVTITDDNGCNISDSYTLTQPNLLSASATLSSSTVGGYNINCNGNSDGSITLNTTGGIPAYSYSWSTADGSGIVIADKDQSGLTAGTYIVSITDVNSCNFSDSYTLIQPDPLTATATFSASTTGGFNINCNGGNDGSISLSVSNGTSPYSYSWTTADGSGLAAGDKDQSGLTAGTYIVTITDANGCLFSDSYTLTQPANPLSVSAVLSSSSDGAYNLNCFADNDGTINITPANGNGTYSYTWSTTDGSGLVASDEDQSGLTAGTYNVTITDDNGCNISDSYTLTQPNLLSASATLSSSTVGGYNINCNGNSDGSITLNTTGGIPAYSYSWSTADGSGIVIADKDQSGLTAGTYIVSITDVNSCNFSDSYTLIQPDPLTATATFSASTTGGFNINCNGGNDGSISLSVSNGTSPYSYSWTTADGSGLAAGDKDQSGLTAGTYNVTITDANGCLFSDSYTLTQPANPLSVSAVLSSSSDGAYNLNCFADNDGTINITPANGNGTYSYTWSTTDGSGLVASDEDQSGLTAGTYNVTITDANGCNISDSYTLAEPDLINVNAVVNDITCTGAGDGSITLNTSGGIPAYSYSWSTVDGSGIVATDKDQSGLAAGTYYVSITDANNCSFTDNYSIIEPQPIKIDSTKIVNVDCFGSSTGEISVYASLGTLPYNFTLSPAILPSNTDGHFIGLPKGDYTITVIDGLGCTPVVTNPLKITEPTSELILDSIVTTDITCNLFNDGTLNIYASGGNEKYEYSIDNQVSFSTDQIFENLPGGNYQVSVRDSGGCVLNAGSYDIINPDPILIHTNITDVSTCSGDATGEIKVTATGGWSPIEFSLDGITYLNSGIFSNIIAGNYTVFARDSLSCQTSAATSVNEPDPLGATITSTNYINDELGKISINNENGGTPPYEYSIEGLFGTFGTNSEFTNLLAGIYEVVVRDANNCIYSESVEILEYPLLAVTLDTTHVSCFGEKEGSLVFHTADEVGEVLYSINGGNSYSSNPVFDNLAGDTTYYLHAFDEGGNEYYDTIYISQPEEITLDKNITPANCNAFSLTGSVVVTPAGGTGNKSFNWSNNSTSKDLIDIESGWYYLKVMDEAGCELMDSTYIPYITFVEANAGEDTTVCEGTSMILDGSPGNVVFWEPEDYLSNQTIPNPVITNITEPVSYIYTVTEVSSGFNCSNTDTLNINVLPVYGIDIPDDTVAILGQSIQLMVQTEGTFTEFEWIPAAGLDNSTILNPVVTPETSTIYRLLATNDYGCLETDSMLIEVFDNITVYNAFSPNDDGKNDFFEIDRAESFPNIEVEVFTRWGQQIFYSKGYDHSKHWDGTFKGKKVPVGTYYYIIIAYPGANPIKGNVTIIR